VHATALHGTVRSYRKVYADSLYFFSGICFVDNEKKKRKKEKENTSV